MLRPHSCKSVRLAGPVAAAVRGPSGWHMLLKLVQRPSKVSSPVVQPQDGAAESDRFAIRVTSLSRSFGVPLSLKQPSFGVFLRIMLKILGFKVDLTAHKMVRASIMIGGQVLEDVSFEVKEGSVVCITGAGGSGKSTLLKILAGVLPPTRGRVEIRGLVSSILNVGDNVEPSESALETIERHCRFNGFAIPDITAYAKTVIAFADLQGFESVPVRKFSTGMRMRLCLALALTQKASVFLIDDVLGVGDIAFQQKCVQRLAELKAAGCTVMIVASDDTIVGQMATRVICIGGGRILSDAPASAISVEKDAATPIKPGVSGSPEITWRIVSRFPAGEAAAISSLALVQSLDQRRPMIELLIDCDVKIAPQRCRPSIDVTNGSLVVFRSLYPQYLHVAESGPIRFTVAIPVDLLPQANSNINIAILSEQDGVVFVAKSIAAVTLHVRRVAGTWGNGQSTPLVSPALAWETELISESSS